MQYNWSLRSRKENKVAEATFEDTMVKNFKTDKNSIDKFCEPSKRSRNKSTFRHNIANY